MNRTRMYVRIYAGSLIFLGLLLAANASAQSKTVSAEAELRRAVDAALDADIFARTLSAVEVTDLRSGKVIYSRNADLLLRPASNAKLVTSAAAVLGLDSSARFRTRLAAVDSSRRTLVCIGGADPLLTSQDIQKLAESAYAAGVLRVDTLILDGSMLDEEFYGAGWMWDDENDPFMPYLSAFPVDGNTITLRMSSPAQTGAAIEVRTVPSSDFIIVHSSAVSGRRSDLRIEKIPRSNVISLAGTVASGRRVSRRVSMWRPQDIFADLLLGALRAAGASADSVVILHDTRAAPLLPIGEISHPLDEALAEMNKESDNLSAESVLRLLGASRKSDRVSAGDGLAAVEGILKRAGIETGALHLRDGSGISFYNLLTARTLSSLLTVLAAHPRFPRFIASLSVAGKDGTLARRMTDMQKGAFFRGKTGTVSGVSALSGYAQAPGGRLLGIVMLMQNFHGRPSPYRDAQDEIVRHCIRYSGAAK